MRERLGVRLYEDWKRLPRERRREIDRAVAEGRAVTDVRDAEVAARLAAAVEGELLEVAAPTTPWKRVTDAFWRFHWIAGLFIVAAAVVVMVGQRDVSAVWLLLSGAGAIALGLPSRRPRDYESRLASAASAKSENEALIPEDAFRGA